MESKTRLISVVVTPDRGGCSGLRPTIVYWDGDRAVQRRTVHEGFRTAEECITRGKQVAMEIVRDSPKVGRTEWRGAKEQSLYGHVASREIEVDPKSLEELERGREQDGYCDFVPAHGEVIFAKHGEHGLRCVVLRSSIMREGAWVTLMSEYCHSWRV